MADRLFDDNEYYCTRFSCECLHPAHIVDFSVELWGDEKGVSVDFTEKYTGFGLTFLERVMRAIKLLLGKEVWGHGFTIRKGDIPEMIELLGKAKDKI